MKKAMIYLIVLVAVSTSVSKFAFAGGDKQRGEVGEGGVVQNQECENIVGYGPFTNFID